VHRRGWLDELGAETEIVFIPRYRDKADEVRLSEERQNFPDTNPTLNGKDL
jgi:hypothetical protein